MAQLFSLGVIRFMTIPEFFSKMEVLIKEKEAKRFAWIRHLVLLASGSLSVLVSLRGSDHVASLPHYCMVAGVAALGLGILSGAVALHGEVWTANDLVYQMGLHSKRLADDPSAPFPGILSQNPLRYRIAEVCCYICFSIAVISLVVYTIVSK